MKNIDLIDYGIQTNLFSRYTLSDILMKDSNSEISSLNKMNLKNYSKDIVSIMLLKKNKNI